VSFNDQKNSLRFTPVKVNPVFTIFSYTFSKRRGTEAELTPTMKLKRRIITQKCQKHIDEMYAG
jgi:long-subunit acyl-CoA synthetase (AMP-forming)